MCLGMTNGYRVPEEETKDSYSELKQRHFPEEQPETNIKTIIEKTEEQLSKAETDDEKIYLLAFLDGAKAQKEENQILMKTLFPSQEVYERRLKAKDAEIQKLINERAYLKRKLAKSPENRFSYCVRVEHGEIYTKSLADYDKLIIDIKKCIFEEIERAYKARKIIVTNEPVRYVRIPLNMFEKLVEEKIKTPEFPHKQKEKVVCDDGE